MVEQGPDGNQRYGDGRVFAEPARVQSTVIDGLEIDFTEVFASLLD